MLKDQPTFAGPVLLWLPLTNAQIASIRRGKSLRLKVHDAEDMSPVTIVVIRRVNRPSRRRVGRYIRRGYQT